MVSRKTFNVIKFAWDTFVIFIIIVVNNTYHLNFWVFMVIAVPIMTAGDALIRKFFVVSE